MKKTGGKKWSEKKFSLVSPSLTFGKTLTRFSRKLFSTQSLSFIRIPSFVNVKKSLFRYRLLFCNTRKNRPPNSTRICSLFSSSFFSKLSTPFLVRFLYVPKEACNVFFFSSNASYTSLIQLMNCTKLTKNNCVSFSFFFYVARRREFYMQTEIEKRDFRGN